MPWPRCVTAVSARTAAGSSRIRPDMSRKELSRIQFNHILKPSLHHGSRIFRPQQTIVITRQTPQNLEVKVIHHGWRFREEGLEKIGARRVDLRTQRFVYVAVENALPQRVRLIKAYFRHTDP